MKGSIKKFVVVVLSMVLSLSLMDVALPAESNVAVVEAATKKPKLNKTKVTLIKGKTVQLKLSNSKNVKWSSSKKSVATVSKSGKVTAKKKGTAVISAKYKGKTYKCTVTVETPKLSKATLTLTENDKYTLKVSGTKQKVTWSSSNKKVATVKSGVVTAKSAGTAKITAKVGTKKYVCSVTVETKEIPLTALIPSQTELSMTKGQSQAITVSALPSNTTETLSLSYVSSNSAVATVDGNGNIIAVGAGDAVITISNGSVSTAVKVNVSVPITGILLDKTEVTMNKGERISLQCTIIPEDTTEDKTVTWESSDNSIATVDGNGVVTGKKEGTVIITAKVMEKECKCYVKVKEICIKTIFIPESISTYKDLSVKLDISYYPLNATNVANVQYVSSDVNIASVDSTGMILAKNVGECTITVKCDGVESTCKLVVQKNKEMLKEEALDEYNAKVEAVRVEQQNMKDIINNKITNIKKQGYYTGTELQYSKERQALLNSIKKLESEIAAMQGVTDAYTKSLLARKQAELDELEEELDYLIKLKSNATSIEGLQELYQERTISYNEVINQHTADYQKKIAEIDGLY